MTRIASLLLNFEERIPRRGFWSGLILLAILAFVLMLVLGTLAGPYWEPHAISSIGMLFLLYPSLAVGVKRLHDRNKSAFPWAFIFFGPQIVTHVAQLFDWGFVAARPLPGAPEGVMIMQPTHPVTIALSILSIIVFVWAIIELGFLKGTEGPNRFGEDPAGQW